MAATKLSFSPSVNIVRDSSYSFSFIPTRNATLAFTSILNDAKVGIKSHVLIGAYGTGKSSFALAFKQTLEGSFLHFSGNEKLLENFPKYEFISIVGEYASLESHFAKYLGLTNSYSTNDIIKGIDKLYKANKKKGKGLAILIDEFGKFLEYAVKHNPESELYFIQQLAEWVNDSATDTLFISTLHQDFSAYALQLTKLQRQEWEKVKGRIKDVPFNEPVEQLLLLASERISHRFHSAVLDKNFDRLFDTIKDAKAFPLKDFFEKEFAKKLFPFDILSASVLTLSLQKYGQNERSLFSFVESNDHLGINEFDYRKNGYYSIPRIYDYLLNGYYSFLTTKYNPHYTQWSAIRRGLERIEGIFEDRAAQKSAEDIIKLVGLLNIFATASAKLEPRFYINYGKYALGIKNPEQIIHQLEKSKIIRYVNHSFRYILFEGTDLDIEIAIDDAGRLVEKVTNIVDHLHQQFEFPFISAKAAYYEKGTPRFFQFKLTEEPITSIPEGEIDGFINLVFSDDSKATKKIEETSLQTKEAILFGHYKNTSEIKNLLFEIQKVSKVKENNRDDKVAIKELDSIAEHYQRLLYHYVLDNLYTNNGNIVWYFQGVKVKINDRRQFNQQLSIICEAVYPNTPVYKNELVNKSKLSGQVALARKKLVDKLLNSLDIVALGFSDSEFPPEKSIFLSLLRETGIYQFKDGIGALEEPKHASFAELWDSGNHFLESTKNKERNLNEFIQQLSIRPFKLKQGFIDFWVPIFLIAKADEFALFHEGIYVPKLNVDILDLLNKKPQSFSVKAFDVVGVKLELFNRYRVFLMQSENQKPTNKTFIQTIKPFLSFYKELPEYAKRTNRLDRKTMALRKVIAEAKDPEKAFFEDFPNALGYSLQDLQHKHEAAEQFLKQLQGSIQILRTSFDGLVDRFENFLVNEVLGSETSFPEYKLVINDRFKHLKFHLLQPHQKTIISRLQSTLEDRKAWLSSLAQACVGKGLEKLTDEDEVLLFEKLNDIFYELDNLTEISKEQINDESEEIVKVEITSMLQGFYKSNLRISTKRNKAVQSKMIELKSALGEDKKMNIVILTKLLLELLQND